MFSSESHACRRGHRQPATWNV